MNILLTYPEFPETFWSYKHALKFIDKRAVMPPLGLMTIASMLPKEWNVRLVDMNVQRLRKRDLDWADYVFLSAMVAQRDSVVDAIARCKAAGVCQEDAARVRAAAGSRTPLAHQMRQAPSSETMQGPMGWRGVQARPYRWHSFG